jgi:hypothetical protein
MQSAVQRAYGNVTRLGVHLSAVHTDPRVREIELRRALEAQAALAEVALVFSRVEFDSHTLIVLTIRPWGGLIFALRTGTTNAGLALQIGRHGSEQRGGEPGFLAPAGHIEAARRGNGAVIRLAAQG